MGQIVKLSSALIPREFRKIDGIGIFRLENDQKHFVGRSLSGSSDELSKGVERVLIPYRKSYGSWDFKLAYGFKEDEFLPKRENYSDFGFQLGFDNFPKYGETVFYDSERISKVLIEHRDNIVHTRKDFINGKEYLNSRLIDFDKPIAYDFMFFLGKEFNNYKKINESIDTISTKRK